jgi:hypothetical protein
MKTTKILSLLCLLSFVMLVSCKDDEPETKTIPYIYFTDSYDETISKLSLDSFKISVVKDVVEMSGVGLAYDEKHSKMFLADFYDEDTPDGKIWKMNLDGTEAVAIVSGLLNPFGIAVDGAGGKVYWGDELGNVSRSNLDGTGKENVVHTEDDGLIRTISLDVENNKMYFFDTQYDKLYVSNLDGTDLQVLIEGAYGFCIFVDTKNNKIYYNDNYELALMSANLDGTGIVEIFKNTDPLLEDYRVYGIAIDYSTNKLYWSCRDAGEIYEANLNGTSKVTLATGLTSPRQIFLKK